MRQVFATYYTHFLSLIQMKIKLEAYEAASYQRQQQVWPANKSLAHSGEAGFAPRPT